MILCFQLCYFILGFTMLTLNRGISNHEFWSVGIGTKEVSLDTMMRNLRVIPTSWLLTLVGSLHLLRLRECTALPWLIRMHKVLRILASWSKFSVDMQSDCRTYTHQEFIRVAAGTERTLITDQLLIQTSGRCSQSAKVWYNATPGHLKSLSQDLLPESPWSWVQHWLPSKEGLDGGNRGSLSRAGF